MIEFRNILIDSFIYPFKDIRKIAILIIIFLGSFLIVPLFIGFGYLLKIVDHTLQGNDGFPDYGSLSDLLSRGLKFFAINLIYSLLFGLFVMMASLPFVYSVTNHSTLLIINQIISFIISYIINWLFVLGLANMVYNRRFSSGINFSQIFGRIAMFGHKKYSWYILLYSIIIFLIQIPGLIMNLFGDKLPSSAFAILIGWNIIALLYISIVKSRFSGLMYPQKSHVE
ncbi:MAG: DUF4013 domain-containing protein [Methanobacterium sp. ERen5]|nr:MAG: DUF4013 domain-containing protein [Methanobacterium sp. ERen5]